jgi:hypothetical protein
MDKNSRPLSGNSLEDRRVRDPFDETAINSSPFHEGLAPAIGLEKRRSRATGLAAAAGGELATVN